MKEIAYIRSGSFYDDSRATKEVKALSEAGYRVHIIGWDRDGVANEKCKEIFNNRVKLSFYNKPIEGVIGYKGIIKLVGFVFFVIKRLFQLRKRLFAIHACDFDGGVGAYFVCKFVNIPLIYDIYDYYIDSHDLSGLIGKIVEKLEIRIIDFARTTIICTEERKKQISKAHPQKVVVIYNSPDLSDIEEYETKYDYVYCGAFSKGRLLDEIIHNYKYNTDLTILMAGSGLLKKQILKISNTQKKFIYVGAIPYNEVLEFEAKAKVISAIYNPNKRNHVLCAPNKFYEALGLGKPVIVCKGTGIDRIVENEKIGIAIEYNAEEFFDAIRYFINNPELRSEYGKRARQLFEQKYQWKLMIPRLLNIYSEFEKELL